MRTSAMAKIKNSNMKNEESTKNSTKETRRKPLPPWHCSEGLVVRLILRSGFRVKDLSVEETENGMDRYRIVLEK